LLHRKRQEKQKGILPSSFHLSLGSMNMSHIVFYTEKAEQDIANVYRYIAMKLTNPCISLFLDLPLVVGINYDHAVIADGPKS